MPNRIYVKVSEDHIKNGIQEDSCACPVALALAEMRVASGKDVSVEETGVEIGDTIYDCSDKLIRFIRDFDENGLDGKEVYPRSFYLTP